MPDFRSALKDALEAEIDRWLLTEELCVWCGLPRLIDPLDHHVCRRDPLHEFTGLVGFVTDFDRWWSIDAP